MHPLRNRGMALSLAALVLGQAGCLGPMGGVSTSTLAPAPPVAKKAEQLPQDKEFQATLEYAQSLDKGGQEDAAVEQFEKVLKLKPDQPDAVRRLAVLYDRRSEFSKAEAEYRKAAKARPRDADLFCDWGYSYYLRNNWAEAESKLRHALELDKKHVRARCNLGLTLGQQDRYQEALQCFRDAGLDEADAHCDLAFIYWTKHRLDDARRECEAARKLNPGCNKAQDLLTQLDAPAKPRGDIAAAKPGAGRRVADGRPARPDARPPSVGMIDFGDLSEAPPIHAPPVQAAAGGYSLPPGWAPVHPQTPPPAPAPAAAGQGVPATVSFE